MRREPLEEARRWLTHAQDEFYELLQRAEEADSDFEKVRRAASLDQYYIPTRYPNGLPGGVPSRFYTDPDEAHRAMELASMVLEMVGDKLG